MAFAGEVLTLLVIVQERLDLDLDHAVPPAEDRLDRFPPGGLAPPQRHVVLHLDELEARRRRKRGDAVFLQDGRLPAERQQRLVQRPHGVGIADNRFHPEDVLDEATEMPELFVGADEAIQAEDRVDHLVPDLLLRFDAADELVDAPLIHSGRLILDNVGDQAGPAPGGAVVIPEAPQLTAAEIEVGLRVEVGRRDALHQREALLRRLDFPDDDALEGIRGVEECLAQQLADAVQLFLAVPDHAREARSHLRESSAAEFEDVCFVRRRFDATAHRVEVADEVVDVRLVRDEPQGRRGGGEGHDTAVGPRGVAAVLSGRP